MSKGKVLVSGSNATRIEVQGSGWGPTGNYLNETVVPIIALISAGYDVETSVDGAEAWNKIQQHRYNCIVSDIEMPNMNGWDLCARVKRNAAFADIPFVLITSLSKDEECQRGLELGADAYLVKGLFNEQELLDTVERLAS